MQTAEEKRLIRNAYQRQYRRRRLETAKGRQQEKIYVRNRLRNYKDRYNSDPEYRERAIARSKATYQAKKNDPVYMAKKRLRQEKLNRRKRATPELWKQEQSRCRARMRMKVCGYGQEDVARLLAFQNYKCPGCGVAIGDADHLDHSHETGRARAMLCPKCNKVLAFCNDNPNVLRRLIELLADPPADRAALDERLERSSFKTAKPRPPDRNLSRVEMPRSEHRRGAVQCVERLVDLF